MKPNISKLKEAMGILTRDPQVQPRPLIEVVAEQGDIDIGGCVFDWGNNFDCPTKIEDITDGYSLFTYFVGQEVLCEKFVYGWYSPCRVEEFINKYLPVFKKFFNGHNREGFRPKDWPESDNYSEDKGFYDTYLESFKGLLNGSYSEESYLSLVKSLMIMKNELDKRDEKVYNIICNKEE